MSGIKIDNKKIEEFCHQNRIEFQGIFGSAARGEDKPDSDLDLLVRFAPDSRGGYFKLVNVENLLSEELGRKVDLVTEGALSPYIRDRVVSDLQAIYGQP